MSATNFMTQQNFLNQLGKYVNHGSLNKTDILLGYVAPTFPFKKNATHLCDLHSELNYFSKGKIVNVIFQKYNGTNSSVKKISNFIRERLINEVKAVLIHGSLATNEEIPYSDFDALVILKDEVFKSPKRLANAAINLSKCYSLMLEFDPLQHHGWFVMSEVDLKAYPERYLPPEVLPYCCSLLDPIDLSITIPEEKPTNGNFFRLVNSLKKQLHSQYIPGNLFVAKSILSEFMMLPTLFIQHKSQTGIYKKLSFEKARTYFISDEWKVMDEVSGYRLNWNNGGAKLPFTTPCVISVSKKKSQKTNAPKLPEHLVNAFQTGLATRMLKFIDTMTNKINEA